MLTLLEFVMILPVTNVVSKEAAWRARAFPCSFKSSLLMLLNTNKARGRRFENLFQFLKFPIVCR